MILKQTPSGMPITLLVVRGFATLFIIALTLLSMWAVGQVQWEKGASDDVIHFWYLAAFLLCEAWTALGLILLGQLYVSRAWLAFYVALCLWIPALILSGIQENEFHKQQALKGRAEFSADIQSYNNAESGLADLSHLLSQMVVQRPVEAVEVELALYERKPLKYPTKITELKSELAMAQHYYALLADQKRHREVLEAKAAVSVERSEDLSQEHRGNWLLIGWMMAMKACGAWVISFLAQPKKRIQFEQPLRSKAIPNKGLPETALDGRPMRIMS